MPSQNIEFEVVVKNSPEEVFAMLTDKEVAEKKLYRLEGEGDNYVTCFGGPYKASGKYLKKEGKDGVYTIKQTWTATFWEEKDCVSVVEYNISKTENGTLIHFTQTGAPDKWEDGWSEIYWRRFDLVSIKRIFDGPILGYWGIQGLAEPARMMLHQLGVPFYDKKYYSKTTPEKHDISCWTDVKYKLGLALPNLPYLIDRKKGLVISQSNAVFKYLGEQLGLGKDFTDVQHAEADMVAYEISDIRQAFVDFSYRDKRKEIYGSWISRKFERLENYVKGRGTKYLVADTIAWCDYHGFVMMEQHMEYFKRIENKPNHFEKEFPTLYAVFKRMSELKGVKAVTSGKRLPMNNKNAHFV